MLFQIQNKIRTSFFSSFYRRNFFFFLVEFSYPFVNFCCSIFIEKGHFNLFCFFIEAVTYLPKIVKTKKIMYQITKIKNQLYHLSVLVLCKFFSRKFISKFIL
jgi:hypothetical protein